MWWGPLRSWTCAVIWSVVLGSRGCAWTPENARQVPPYGQLSAFENMIDREGMDAATNPRPDRPKTPI